MTGNEDQKVVRSPDGRRWVWHSVKEEWFTAEESGKDGAGRGFQNPDDVLAALAAGAPSARITGAGEATLTLEGDVLRKLARDLVGGAPVDWKKSKATVKLSFDDVSRIRTVVCDLEAELDAKDMKGTARLKADVRIGAFGRAVRPPFLDDDRREIPLNDTLREALAPAPKKK